MGDQSPLLQNIGSVLYGFGNKSTLLPTALLPYRASLPVKKQVHGTRIVEITSAAQACGEADGFYTREKGVLMTVLTADCLPIIFSRRDGQAAGVVHAGWRGLLAGIIDRMAQYIAQDDRLDNWIAAIGPAAGPCCYQVNQELVDSFIQALPELSPAVISPSHRHLDLRAIAFARLQALGFHAVDRAGGCTVCTLDGHGAEAERFRYTSYRRTRQQQAINPLHPGIAGRNQHSGIVLLS